MSNFASGRFFRVVKFVVGSATAVVCSQSLPFLLRHGSTLWPAAVVTFVVGTWGVILIAAALVNPTKTPSPPMNYAIYILLSGLLVMSFSVAWQTHARRLTERTEGQASDTRVVKLAPLRNSSVTLYRGQCMVTYSVSGRQYNIWWDDADNSNSSATFVADRMVECPYRTFVVHYAPGDPAQAEVEALISNTP
jgi:hypothetical protein